MSTDAPVQHQGRVYRIIRGPNAERVVDSCKYRYDLNAVVWVTFQVADASGGRKRSLKGRIRTVSYGSTNHGDLNITFDTESGSWTGYYNAAKKEKGVLSEVW